MTLFHFIRCFLLIFDLLPFPMCEYVCLIYFFTVMKSHYNAFVFFWFGRLSYLFNTKMLLSCHITENPLHNFWLRFGLLRPSIFSKWNPITHFIAEHTYKCIDTYTHTQRISGKCCAHTNKFDSERNKRKRLRKED